MGPRGQVGKKGKERLCTVLLPRRLGAGSVPRPGMARRVGPSYASGSYAKRAASGDPERGAPCVDALVDGGYTGSPVAELNSKVRPLKRSPPPVKVISTVSFENVASYSTLMVRENSSPASLVNTISAS